MIESKNRDHRIKDPFWKFSLGQRIVSVEMDVGLVAYSVMGCQSIKNAPPHIWAEYEPT